MNIPIPAETPDPNIDQPTLPPSEPEPIPEQEPPEKHPATQGRPAHYHAAGGGQRLSPGACPASKHRQPRGEARSISRPGAFPGAGQSAASG